MNKNNIFITIKKELRSMFRDKKTLFMIFGFPFIIAFMIFLMGFMEESILGEDGTTYNVGFNFTVNEVQQTLLDEYSLENKYFDSVDKMKDAFEDGEISGYLVYEEDDNVYTIYTDTSMGCMNVSTFLASYLEDYNQYLGNLKLVIQVLMLLLESNLIIKK